VAEKLAHFLPQPTCFIPNGFIADRVLRLDSLSGRARARRQLLGVSLHRLSQGSTLQLTFLFPNCFILQPGVMPVRLRAASRGTLKELLLKKGLLSGRAGRTGRRLNNLVT
jgi:hypothetical protein